MGNIECDTPLIYSVHKKSLKRKFRLLPLVLTTVPSVPSGSAQTLDQLLEVDYQDSQIDPDNITHYSLTQFVPLLVSTFV